MAECNFQYSGRPARPVSAFEESLGSQHGHEEEDQDHGHVLGGHIVSPSPHRQNSRQRIAMLTALVFRSVTIISILRLRSLIVFANTSNVSCKLNKEA